MYSFSNKRFSLSRSLLNRRKSFSCSFQNNASSLLFRFFTKLSVLRRCKSVPCVCVLLYKKTKGTTREKKKNRSGKKKIDTLNKKDVERSSPPCVSIERLGRFLHISRSILFPKNVIVSIQQRRAQTGITQNRHAHLLLVLFIYHC